MRIDDTILKNIGEQLLDWNDNWCKGNVIDQQVKFDKIKRIGFSLKKNAGNEWSKTAYWTFAGPVVCRLSAGRFKGKIKPKKSRYDSLERVKRDV